MHSVHLFVGLLTSRVQCMVADEPDGLLAQRTEALCVALRDLAQQRLRLNANHELLRRQLAILREKEREKEMDLVSFHR